MIRLCLLGLLFIAKCSFSQELNVINCLKGNQIELIKSSDVISASKYLLNIRTASDIRDFQHLNNSNGYGHNWFIMMNENGDTLWKKILPNTQNAVYAKYITSGFTFRIPEFDFSHDIYSKTNDELILNYSYYDSLSYLVTLDNNQNILQPYDSIRKVRNVLMAFGSINISDGSYKTEPFVIDALLKFPQDTSIFIESSLNNKINDSIYQMAVVYKKQYFKGVFYEPDIWRYIKLYTINSSSKSVIKQTYQYNTYDRLINEANRFYWLHYTLFSDNCTINKFNLNGTIELSQSIKTRINVPYINYVKTTGDNNLILGGIDNRDAVLFKINLNDFTFSTSFYNTHENYYYSFSEISNIPNFTKYKLSYSMNENPYTQNDSYFLLNEIYQETDTSVTEDKRYLAKVSESTGNIVTRQDIGTKKIMDINENEILMCSDSIYDYNDSTIYYHNYTERIDSNYNLIWNTKLADSLLIDSIWYYAASEIIDYFPVNYYNQFIISVFYDESISAGNNKINVFFLLSNESGLVKKINVTKEQSLRFKANYELAGQFNLIPVLCINTGNNELSIISNNINQCSQVDSNLDVVIYKYNEVLNAVKSNKYIAKDDFVLFPNPTNNTINIQFNSSQIIENATLKIMDISGRIVYSSILKNELQHTIDVHQLPDGMYFLQIDDAKELHQIKKFQVIH
jgi:hypothetical protein